VAGFRQNIQSNKGDEGENAQYKSDFWLDKRWSCNDNGLCMHTLQSWLVCSRGEDEQRRASLRGGKCAAVVHTAKQLSRTYRIAAEQRTSPVHTVRTSTAAQEAGSARLSTLDWAAGPTVVNSRRRNEAIHHALMGKSNALVVTPTGLLIGSRLARIHYREAGTARSVGRSFTNSPRLYIYACTRVVTDRAIRAR